MAHSRPSPVESQGDTLRSNTFECTPWLAQERVLEEPRQRSAEPLELAINEHVVDAPLDGEAIVRAP
jgi:hypothetical protein